MPIVQINLIEGRSLAQKKALVENVTKAVCESVDAPAENVRIILSEMQKDSYAIGGTLIVDRE